MDYSKDANHRRTSSKSRKRRKRKNSVGVILIRILLVVIVVGGFAVVGAGVGAYMGIIENTDKLSAIDVIPESYTSFIYDDLGNEIDSLHGEENREYVKLDQIPLDLQNAVIAIEDERFYTHSGIDFKGMLRALVVNLKSHDMSQGASTITQQLIKNEVLSSEKKLTRKLQEQYLAVQFEKELEKKLGSKDRAKKYILELYLNTIGLNHGLNGVQAAAKFYYGKDVSQLDLAECASIAGITKNPSKYSPLSNPEKNKERQMTVLTKMLELGYITQSDFNEASQEDIYANIVGGKNDEEQSVSIHNWFVDELVTEIADDLQEQKGYSRQQAYNLIYSGGLKIYSTENQQIQQIMEESYKNDSLFPPSDSTLDVTYTISILDTATEEQKHYTRTTSVTSEDEVDAFIQSVQDELLDSTHTLVLDNKSVNRSLQSSMVVMDYHTGAVKGLVGGRGEKSGDLIFNRATQALRQPGSCFKVLASYAPAIDMGLMYPGTIIMDEPFDFNGWRPKNWYSGYRGAQTVRVGVRDSMNILAAKTLQKVGIDNAFQYMLDFGFTTLVDQPDENGNTDRVGPLCLGGITRGVSVLELTAAYGAIANEGEYLKPTLYSKVLDHDGNVLLEYTPEPKRILKETTAWLLTDMMEDVITSGTGRLARFSNVKMPIAGKTGTTTDDKDLTFAGYTPYYVGGIWLGYDNPKRISYDKSYHLLLWSDVMEKIHQAQNLEYIQFERPDGIVTKTCCSESGKQAIPGLCDADYYGAGAVSDYCASDFNSDNAACNVHKSFTICSKTGKLINEFCPEDSHMNVVLAVDPETGDIMNKPSSNESGKMDIDIKSTCNLHNANNTTDSTESNMDPIGSETENEDNKPKPPVDNGTPAKKPDNGTPIESLRDPDKSDTSDSNDPIVDNPVSEPSTDSDTESTLPPIGETEEDPFLPLGSD